MTTPTEPPVTPTPEPATVPFSVVQGELPPDSKPRKGRTKSVFTGQPASKATAYQPGVIARGLTELYTNMGSFLGMFDPQCSMVIITNAQAMAESLEKLAKDNPAIRAALMRVITGSVWGEVIAAHMPVMMAITMHHTAFGKARMEAVQNLTDENLAKMTQPTDTPE